MRRDEIDRTLQASGRALWPSRLTQLFENNLIEDCEVARTIGEIGGFARDIIIPAILFKMALTIRPRQ